MKNDPQIDKRCILGMKAVSLDGFVGPRWMIGKRSQPNPRNRIGKLDQNEHMVDSKNVAKKNQMAH